MISTSVLSRASNIGSHLVLRSLCAKSFRDGHQDSKLYTTQFWTRNYNSEQNHRALISAYKAFRTRSEVTLVLQLSSRKWKIIMNGMSRKNEEISKKSPKIGKVPCVHFEQICEKRGKINKKNWKSEKSRRKCEKIRKIWKNWREKTINKRMKIRRKRRNETEKWSNAYEMSENAVFPFKS